MSQIGMRRRIRFLLLCVLLAISVSVLMQFVSGPPRVQAANTVVKIMPLGDSITGSPGCWRALLWNQLQSAGYTNIDFVGTLPPQGCGVSYDGDNEGHGGILATNIASQNLLPAWLTATNPDLVLMHLGTNDAWNNIPTSNILAAYSTMVNQMRANNPQMKILVAQIIPMNPSTCTYCAQGVIALNAAIPAWANTKTTSQSPIIVVDQWTGFNDITDTADGVHPNDLGIVKIANKWFPPLTAQLSQVSTPTSTPTSTTTSTPTSTPITSNTCKVAYVLQNQWPGGFTANITITNTSSITLNSWSLAFRFPDSTQHIDQGWSAIFLQNMQQVTAINQTWNASLAPNASVNIGFNGTFVNTNPLPTSFTLNNQTCTKI